VYAPRLNEPGALEARQRLARLIRSGDLVIQRTGQDKYGRTLGRVFVDGDRITQLDINGQSGRRITRQATRPKRL
jgi:endonuclease YncB( thermonuclease family)